MLLLVAVGLCGLVVAVVGDVVVVGRRGPAAVVSLSEVELGLDGLIVDGGAVLVAGGGLLVVGVAGRK